MNQLLFEGRTLVGIVASIVRQDALHVMFNRLDWERMFRLSVPPVMVQAMVAQRKPVMVQDVEVK